MPNKFGHYEIVKVKGRQDLPLVAVRGWNETGMVYELRLPDGQTAEAHEEQLETVEKYETPFRYYEVVEIHPVDLQTEPTVVDLIGKRGIVTSISANDYSGVWGFGVAIQNGERWYFEQNELRSTGIMLSEEELYGTDVEHLTVRLHWNPATGEETVVSGDPSFLHRGPTPLRIDLEAL